MLGDIVYADKNYDALPEDEKAPNYLPTVIRNGSDIDFADETNCIGDAGVYIPIPMSSEILDKNGFKYAEFPRFAVNEITEKTNVMFSNHSGSNTIFIGISKPNFNLTSACILYVHELQHLFRDAHIDKEITV